MLLYHVKKIHFFILFFALSFSAFATHERAGEITYRRINGYTYEISVTTYTKLSSTQADRCSIEINFGDDTSHYQVCRSNFEISPIFDPQSDPKGATCSIPNCSTHHMGEWSIGSPSLQSLDIKKNVYTTTHTYAGPYTYTITMTDANRNDGIVNVPDQTPLSLFAVLTIPPFTPGMPTYNNSPDLKNPPIDRACIGKLFIHNPGAVDPDGDSLSYQLGVCYESPGKPISSYFIPAGVSIDPVSGDFIWNSAQQLPPPYALPYEYNFAIDIIEWKLNSINHKRYRVGTVRRDMQVRVYDCQNEPPVISHVNDTCIEANTTLTFTATATDPGNNIIQTFTATGGPFNTIPSATFSSNAPVQSPAKGIFSWHPSCNQVRLQPYLVTFRATDDGSPDSPAIVLSDYESFFIKVIAPAPKNLTIEPKCTSMKLKWDSAACNPTGNKLYTYKVYRKIGCDSLKPGYCQTGVPSFWGYSLVATVPNTSTAYTDVGLVHGFVYAYRVVASYLDGSESYASAPICGKLVRDVSVITNVDVVSTNSTTGSINVKWVKPIPDKANFDTTLQGNKGPYRFDLYRATGFINPTSLMTSFTSPYFATLNPTSLLDNGLNTASNSYTYRVEFYSASDSLCPAQNASSVFLSCNPNDNRIQLTWQENVPWKNYRYTVYKQNKITSNWDSIGTTVTKTFTDTGLVNGVRYCYKVKSIGTYPDTTLPAPIINWSQELCCTPVDLTPPCAVKLNVDSSCALVQNILTWNNPNNSCSDDALYYIVHYTPVQGKEFYSLDTIRDIKITTFIHDSIPSIAGCYAVTSVDSFGNESTYSNIVCVDNCPYYELPNVFTPNGDGSNDFFTPLHPYKYVKDIDIKIYNRWGTEVFRTNDPEIHWDGKSSQTRMLCSDGVYYYICIVNDIRLVGIVPRALKGNIHLLSK